MGAERSRQRQGAPPSVRTLVRATRTRTIPSELLSWSAENSVRVITRATVSEAVAAARDMHAALLVIESGLVHNDPAALEGVFMRAQLDCALLCLGPAPLRAAFLSHGADAYVSDQASVSEVLVHATRLLETPHARLIGESGLQRPTRSVLEVGPMLIELVNRRVFVNHQVVKLRPAEFQVLVYLALNRHRTVSATEIVRDALDAFGDGGSARNQLFELRRKLREFGLADAIVTHRGQGYRLVL